MKTAIEERVPSVLTSAELQLNTVAVRGEGALLIPSNEQEISRAKLSFECSI